MRTVPSETANLARLIRAFCPHDGRFGLSVPGVSVSRYSKASTELIRATARPVVCIAAQGAKQMILGRETYLYDSARVLVLSVDLQISAQVVRASASEPYLCLLLDLNPKRIADLVLKVFPHGLPRPASDARGLCLAPSSPQIINAAERLMESLASPDDAALIAPLVLDEIFIRLLRSPVGVRLAQVGLAESSVRRVSAAIEWLRENFAQPMKVERLAELANMSVSSFHQHFKAVTSVTPLHYQKVLRLQESRRLMLSAMMDAGEAGRSVGYLSASQFSREYARFFGSAPARDVAQLMERGLAAHDVFR